MGGRVWVRPVGVVQVVIPVWGSRTMFQSAWVLSRWCLRHRACRLWALVCPRPVVVLPFLLPLLLPFLLSLVLLVFLWSWSKG